jgi:hypothetical protein
VGLFAAYTGSMRDKLRIAVTFLIVVIVLVAASYWYANGILPQVVSCVAESPPQGSGPRYQPIMIVHVESGGRKAGRFVETHALGCTFYFYNARGTL